MREDLWGIGGGKPILSGGCARMGVDKTPVNRYYRAESSGVILDVHSKSMTLKVCDPGDDLS
jgi:hypothetical protein